ncbi:MAG: HAMP domain-containing histidine kinase [Propionibacteriaceae bacterium]|jgi:signal transduction histidine kinase|nr:HAMP domain-containing histidine kinase [Propionibacteriaceae bacterium]
MSTTKTRTTKRAAKAQALAQTQVEAQIQAHDERADKLGLIGQALLRPKKQIATDDEKVRAAALAVGMAVAGATGVIVLLACIALITIAANNAIPLPVDVYDPRPGFHPPRYGYLSANDVIWTLAMLALVSLIVTPLIAWFVARQAVQPLSRALTLQRRFVADASHELRTPLTALSSRVQILKRRLDSGKPVDEVVNQLHQDTANMANVLDDMLLTVEGQNLGPGTKSSVKTILDNAVTSLDALAEQLSITITLADTPEMFVRVPATSLTRAVVAIVDNAIQHSPANSVIQVSATPFEDKVIIRVQDQGPGITGVDPERIFERFAHGSESGRKRSFGLGLALASEVAQRFGGDIRVESTSSSGTTFALTFPRVAK